MFQYIFDQSITDKKLRRRVFTVLKNRIVKFYDPIVHYQLNGKQVSLNISHMLPVYRRDLPTYSANLTRLTSFIRNEFGVLRMIDVGANIGDSYFLTHPEINDEYLLIEGDASYFALLTHNTQTSQQVNCVRALLSDKPSIVKGGLLLEGGTARIAQEGDKQTTLNQYSTLDQVIVDNNRFQKSNLLKTDVDGYDSKVLMGGLTYIAATTPVLFFEHHPRLLAMAGEDDTYIFSELAHIGYSCFIFYDNMGFLLGVVSAGDVKLIHDLMFYAKQKDGYYYDICCFNDKHTSIRNAFLSKEEVFYSNLIANTI